MISIIIPTLNEVQNIPVLLKELKNIDFKHELIIVDDNSWDGTNKFLKNLKKKNLRFFIRKNKIRDLSKSVLLGIKKSIYDIILVLDCDLQHGTKDANLMKKKLINNNLDLVIGSRFLKSKYSGNLGFLRSLLSYFFILIINFFLKKKTSDPLSGFFICKKKIILKNQNKYFLNGYKILFDIIYNSKCNLKIDDIQISFRSRKYGNSKLNKRIVGIFIKQFFFTFRNNFFLNLK